MDDLSLATIESGKTTVNSAALDALAAQLRGALIVPDDAGYDEARTIWNAMIDRRPGLIVRCAGAADVMQRGRTSPASTSFSSRCAAAATTSPATRCATAA